MNRIAIAAAIMLAALTQLFAQVPIERQTIILHVGMLSEDSRIRTDRPFRTVQVGDPGIADVVKPESDRYFDIAPKAVGTTNIFAYDNEGSIIKEVSVVVDEGGPTRTQVHNKQPVTSYTIYRCWATGCRYVDETVAKEPAPLPPTETVTRVIRERSAPQQ
jgi:Flp pilus assembly secretin CpaC